MSVNSGLFDLLNFNENEIAFVVAHEMGHGQKDHPAKGIKKAMPLSVIASVWGSQSGSVLETVGINVLANYSSANYVTKPQEWEADNLAFDYAADAGYNPGAGAALWQRVVEQMGKSSSNFVGEIFSPSDHPKNEERRENYSKKLTAYSNKHITVSDGVIKVNNKEFMTAGATDATSSAERAFLIAGNLSAVYHNNKTAPNAYVEGGMVKMGNQPILVPNENEPDAQTLADKLNSIK
jgi:predicted Zn-dependent protease